MYEILSETKEGNVCTLLFVVNRNSGLHSFSVQGQELTGDLLVRLRVSYMDRGQELILNEQGQALAEDGNYYELLEDKVWQRQTVEYDLWQTFLNPAIESFLQRAARKDYKHTIPGGRMDCTTYNLQIAGSYDDTECREATKAQTPTATYFRVDSSTSSFGRYWAGNRFTTTGIPQGATVTSADIQWYKYTGTGTRGDIYAEDVDSPADYNGGTAVVDRTLTTANVEWITTFSTGWNTSPDITSVIQEILDRPSFGGNINIIWKPRSDANVNGYVYSYDYGASYAPKLNVDASVATTHSVSGNLTLSITKSATLQKKYAVSSDSTCDITTAATAAMTCSAGSDSTAYVYTDGTIQQTHGLSTDATATVTTEGSLTLSTVHSVSSNVTATVTTAATCALTQSITTETTITTSTNGTLQLLGQLSGDANLTVTTAATAGQTFKVDVLQPYGCWPQITTEGTLRKTWGITTFWKYLRITTSATASHAQVISATPSLAITTSATAEVITPILGDSSLVITTASTLSKVLLVSCNPTLQITTDGSLTSVVLLQATAPLVITTSGRLLAPPYLQELHQFLTQTFTVYPVRLPEAATYPCISYRRIRNPHKHNLSGGSGWAWARIQFDIWDDTLDGCLENSSILKGLLMGKVPTENTGSVKLISEVDLHESPKDGSDNYTYHRAQDYWILYKEQV